MSSVLKEFDAITKIPRPSFHEEKIRDYLYNWAKERNIYVESDEYKNIFMIKPASMNPINQLLFRRIQIWSQKRL